MKESKTKTYIRIPFLTPPNKKHKSVRDYDRRQNKEAVKKEIKEVIGIVSDENELANTIH